MKKLITTGILIAGLSFMSVTVNAQTKETKVSYNKADVNGFENNVEGEKAVVEKALEDYFKKAFNSKSSSSKGYTVYKGVSWPEVSSEKIDVYYKISNKKNNNTVSMMVSKGYDNFVNSQIDEGMSRSVIAFMNSIKDKVVVVNNDNALKAAEDALKEAQKEYDKAVDKGKDLRSDKEKIEKEIASQDNTISDKEKALSKAKADLDAAKAKVK